MGRFNSRWSCCTSSRSIDVNAFLLRFDVAAGLIPLFEFTVFPWLLPLSRLPIKDTDALGWTGFDSSFCGIKLEWTIAVHLEIPIPMSVPQRRTFICEFQDCWHNCYRARFLMSKLHGLDSGNGIHTSFMFAVISSPSAVILGGNPHSSWDLLSELAQSSLSKASPRDVIKCEIFAKQTIDHFPIPNPEQIRLNTVNRSYFSYKMQVLS